MASALSSTLVPALPSWNPLRCGGTALPVNLLIMVKAIAIALLLTNHVRLLPDPFLPFVPALDRIPPLLFQRTVQLVFIASAVTLIFNRSVRLSSFLLGMSIILSVVASKAYYGNNKTLCGFIFFLTSLYQPGQSPWMLRLQLVIVYFGAGLNKILDPDWRSGIFFENWAVNRLHERMYLAMAPLLPHLALAKLMSWFTILTELGLSGAFLIRRLYPAAIWFSLLLHSGMLLFTGSTFTMFFYAMSAAMLVFVDWPKSPLTVVYDADCGFCTRTKIWFERFDLERMFRWQSYQSGAGKPFGIADKNARRQLYMVHGAKVYSGFRAFRMMALYNPVSYLVTFTALAAPGPGDSRFRNVTVALLLLLFSPLFTPVGEALYSLVARNRRRLSSESTCQVR